MKIHKKLILIIILFVILKYNKQIFVKFFVNSMSYKHVNNLIALFTFQLIYLNLAMCSKGTFCVLLFLFLSNISRLSLTAACDVSIK